MDTPKEGRLCHCGKPLHYEDHAAQDIVERFIAAGLSEYVKVPSDDHKRCWLVQRHYIAHHGLKSIDLPNLGFVEITGAPIEDRYIALLRERALIQKALKQIFRFDGCGCISDLPGDNYTCTAHEYLRKIAREVRP